MSTAFSHLLVGWVNWLQGHFIGVFLYKVAFVVDFVGDRAFGCFINDPFFIKVFCDVDVAIRGECGDEVFFGF